MRVAATSNIRGGNRDRYAGGGNLRFADALPPASRGTVEQICGRGGGGGRRTGAMAVNWESWGGVSGERTVGGAARQISACGCVFALPGSTDSQETSSEPITTRTESHAAVHRETLAGSRHRLMPTDVSATDKPHPVVVSRPSCTKTRPETRRG